MSKGLSRYVAPIKQAVVNMVARAVVKQITESTGIQSAQVGILATETRDEVERFQQYGFSSYPLPGAEGLIVFIGGNRDHAVLTNVDDRRHRPKFLAEGEVVIYNQNGDYIHIRANGTMKVVAQTKIEIDCPLVEMSGDLRVKGDIVDRYETNTNNMHGMREIYNIHEHPENDSGGPTDNPNEQM